MSRGKKVKLMKVSSATSPDDVERINAFFNSTEIKTDLHWFTYRDTLDRAFEREDRQLLYVDNDDGEIIGALMVWCQSRVLDPGEAQIRLVAVSPDNRDEGLGRLLCECAEAFARRQSQDRMIADVVASAPAVEFWKSIGYDPLEEWETRGGRSMLTVQKPLD
ncbi:GNAT family N-acetyltransferase [Halobacterium litoreum]|uniref:GNAT family N-acetyltransferase n=1 Tax=Halobacterium litoreum TaxID=2039234 RepID=A0ABD5NF46_9EURY|nr:GNAT family N-acetyltransferase [Halobacterium litoreum]UHH13394.1 GNAT family N-acetyltransferase [Halobacterium litoreum]